MFEYDLSGRRTKVQWADAYAVTYERFVTGEIFRVHEQPSNVAVIEFDYDDLGRRRGIGKSNGRYQGYAWDDADRLTALSTMLPGGASTAWFQYNSASQITQRQTSDDRLSANVAYNVQRSYDANGLNQYVRAGGVVTAYDARGNLTRTAARTFGYDGDNQLTDASGAGFTYGPLGQLSRVSDEGGTKFAYAGDMIAAEYDDAGNLRRRYVPGDGADEVLLQYEGAGYGGRRYYATDERGSVIEVSDQSGATLAINTYDDHGIPAAGNVGRFGYTGQAWMPAAQAWYYHARFYNPLLGRFMQTDPIGYGDGMNWYNYVGGDPVNKTDPSGMLDQHPGSGGGSPMTGSLLSGVNTGAVTYGGYWAPSSHPTSSEGNITSVNGAHWVSTGVDLSNISVNTLHNTVLDRDMPQNDEIVVTAVKQRKLSGAEIDLFRSYGYPLKVLQGVTLHFGIPWYVPRRSKVNGFTRSATDIYLDDLSSATSSAGQAGLIGHELYHAWEFYTGTLSALNYFGSEIRNGYGNDPFEDRARQWQRYVISGFCQRTGC